ncbi:hypothetical protein A6X21_12375 [Planctopirus hydrillae]|uniref:Transposase IS4-like domain-containing protein n=1 Tax=Planctopirus hydrillae TaxID=1841610 RepID=A0A1C3E635_9PLAN|nr:hypothetical protein A6X21_12375 [Planctopirus hydrillae]
MGRSPLHGKTSGLTTKVHAAVDGRGRLLKLILTPGHAGDAPVGEKLLEGLCANHVLADAAYDSDAIRLRVKRMWAQACIKPKGNRKVKKRCVKERYRHRNIIERFFGALKRFRRVATRYEKKSINFAGFLWLASLLTKPF